MYLPIISEKKFESNKGLNASFSSALFSQKKIVKLPKIWSFILILLSSMRIYKKINFLYFKLCKIEIIKKRFHQRVNYHIKIKTFFSKTI
jgi:hypothetical protein